MNEDLRDDDISLFDLLVVVAEHWLILVIVPLLAGALTFGILVLLPETWRTSAVVNLPRTEVLNHLLPSEPENNLPQELLDSLRVTQGIDATQTRIEVTKAPSAEAALADITSVLTYLSSITEERKVHMPRAALAREISSVRANLNLQNSMIDTLEENLAETVPDTPQRSQAYAQLSTSLNDLLVARTMQTAQLDRLEAQLMDLPGSIIRVPAEEPDSSTGTSRLVAVIGVALGTGFVLLLIIFVTRGLRNSAADPENREKIARIRRAFFLRTAD